MVFTYMKIGVSDCYADYFYQSSQYAYERYAMYNYPTGDLAHVLVEKRLSKRP